MSSIAIIPELQGQSFRTRQMMVADVRPIATIAAVILRRYVGDGGWQFIPREGSLTLQSEADNHQVVKVFVDYDNALAAKNGLALSDDPVAVGVELSHLPALVRDAIRDRLAREFPYYVDPRQGPNTKWWLKPVDDHFYDILFLERGPCKADNVEEQLVGAISEQMLSELRHER